MPHIDVSFILYVKAAFASYFMSDNRPFTIFRLIIGATGRHADL